jgi:hypothetical protein
MTAKYRRAGTFTKSMPTALSNVLYAIDAATSAGRHLRGRLAGKINHAVKCR